MATGALPKRSEQAQEHTWNLESIYATDDAWEADFKRLENMIPQLETLAGTLGNDAESLLDALQQRDEAGKLVQQLYVYANLRQTEDLGNPRYQALTDRVMSLYTRFGAATAFFEPEILQIPDERIDEFLQRVDALQVYRFSLDELRRQKAHIRSAEIEALLAQAGEIARGPENIFDRLNDADLKFPVLKDDKGNDVELTHGRYVPVFMESRNREVRRNAFEAMYNTYGTIRNTTGTSLSSHMRGQIFFAKARNYGSALEAALDPHAIPTSVYTNLVESINNNLHHLHRYMKLRKRMLQLDELHMYDIYTPLIPDVEFKYSYDEAREMMVRGLSPLGSSYIDTMRGGLYENRWVDVYENQGKRSGAFSWGAYTTQPFILMNYQDNLNNVYTLAHELGHSMHSYYTRRTQPFVYGNYTIFVAEVASTLNEQLLTDHLLKNTDDRMLQMYILNHQIEEFRGTMYRQTMFAEFELEAYKRMEAGEAMTADSFSSMYYDLNKRYFGPDVVVDDLIALEWSRIPHFYSSFYVYQYATGIAASAALSRQILSEGQGAVDRYLQFLSGGSSQTSIDLLRGAGVDMTTPEPVQQACDVFGDLVTQMEQLADEIERDRRN
jgi:oligoendopeptidase F